MHLYPKVYEELQKAVLERQEWLTKLIVCSRLQNHVMKSGMRCTIVHYSPQQLFPALPWDSKPEAFPWKCAAAWPKVLPRKLQFSDEDWSNFVFFVYQLGWQQATHLQISLAELAVLFAIRGFKCHVLSDEHCTFKSLIRRLQGCLAFSRRIL